MTMKYNVSNITKETWQDKTYLKADLEDEQGQKFPKIAFWGNEINEETKEIEGTLSQNDKGYWKFQTPRKAAGANFASAQKTKAIEEAQERKEKSIHEAQDRSAWMWAKNNAALLIANHPTFKDMDAKAIHKSVESLATKIYNSEPTEPFN